MSDTSRKGTGPRPIANAAMKATIAKELSLSIDSSMPIASAVLRRPIAIAEIRSNVLRPRRCYQMACRRNSRR